MSGVTSTIHDSGRVYLFDRNALPKNFIAAGMKLSADGLTATVSPGTCDISGKFHELASPASITVPQRMACLLYATKNDLVDAPTFGYVQAAFPAADAGTVCQWIIDGSATIASTVGSNNLTKSGTVAQVDGWIGYGGQGDGITGYYTSANSNGFPTGAGVTEVMVGFTYNALDGEQAMLFGYGVNSGTSALKLSTNNDGTATGGLTFFTPTAGYNTSYVLEVGKTYALHCQYDGTTVLIYINGSLIYKNAISLNISAGVMYVLANIGGSPATKSTIHYLELRNALRTPAQIAAISNALLLPCRYYTSETANTYSDIRAILPADTISLGRVRTSSTAILEARMDYQDGRREGAVGGNRTVFLGWQAFSGEGTKSFTVPFDTNKYKTFFVFADDATGRGEMQVTPYVTGSTGYYPYGVREQSRCAGKLAIAHSTSVVYSKTSGYIGCYAEVIE